MKRISLTVLIALGLAVTLTFADEPLSADQMWQHILVLSRATSANPDSQDEIDRLTALESEADMFWQRFADSPYVWEAKLILLQTRLDRAAREKKRPDLRVVESDVKEITDAQTAPASVRAEAAYVLFELNAASVGDASRLPALDTAAAEFVRQYPNSAHAAQIPWERLGIYEQLAPAKVDVLLKEYAADKDPRVAMEARQRIVARDLTKKPLDLKFTAVDGKEFDLQKWRGKVVLVDFWATWCGPCRMEIPNVVAAYKKLHDKGFEIVGISLDSSKDKLLAYTKEKEMTWPQYFDGKVWDNKISRSYGIAGIPATWLVDKKGYVRLTNARDDLEGRVTKLLAE
jgi:thiol-disulfide isomerase/thioredoxin